MARPSDRLRGMHSLTRNPAMLAVQCCFLATLVDVHLHGDTSCVCMHRAVRHPAAAVSAMSGSDQDGTRGRSKWTPGRSRGEGQQPVVQAGSNRTDVFNASATYGFSKVRRGSNPFVSGLFEDAEAAFAGSDTSRPRDAADAPTTTQSAHAPIMTQSAHALRQHNLPASPPAYHDTSPPPLYPCVPVGEVVTGKTLRAIPGTGWLVELETPHVLKGLQALLHANNITRDKERSNDESMALFSRSEAIKVTICFGASTVQGGLIRYRFKHVSSCLCCYRLHGVSSCCVGAKVMQKRIS